MWLNSMICPSDFGTLLSDGKPIKTKDGFYRLIRDWKFKHCQSKYILLVPKDYKCDLASIPKWAFWWKRGLWDIAAIAHDYICEFGKIELMWADDESAGIRSLYLERWEGDRLFYEIAIAVGVHPRTALLMYLGVRIYSIFYGITKINYS
ncbi:MAG: DUF1353 domain-containing protein [Cyanobacteria bacterium P01_G01_bin.19]